MLNFLITLGGISLAMSAVIILMLALQKPIKKRFAALARYIIWSVIIIRLCLPVSLDILPKLITLPSVIPEEEAVIYEPVAPQAEYIPEAVIPSTPSESINEPSTNDAPNETYIPSTPVAEPVPQKPSFEITGEHIIIALFTVWALGAITFVTVTLIRYRKTAKGLDAALSIPAPEVWNIYDTVCRELGIKKAPLLYMGRADVSPMVYGFLNPKVVLPSVEMSAQSMTYVLRHELTHYKRGDLYFKLLAMLANALHWFNPLAYIACGAMSSEAELSCDESALSKTDLVGRLGYGNSMLEIVKLCRHSPKLTTGFSPKKRAVKERFENMINTTKKKKGYWIVAITLICALLCTSIIGCTTKETEPKDTDETGESVTEKYDAVGMCFDMEGDEQRDWTLTAKDGIVTLEHIWYDGSIRESYSYGDASKHDGVIDIDPAFEVAEENRYDYILQSWVASEYAIIQYDVPSKSIEECPNSYFVTVDLRDGSVTNKIRYEVDDILEIHGLDRDVLSVYESWGDRPPEYCINVDVLLYEPAEAVRTTQMMLTYSLTTTDQKKASFYVYFDMLTGELSEIEKGHCNLTKYTSNDVVTDVADISKIDGVDDDISKAAEAFLKGDITTLERLGEYDPGFLDDLKSIKFGDYRITRIINDRGLEIEGYVTESQTFNVNKGFHTFTVTKTVVAVNPGGKESIRVGVNHNCVGCLYPEVENYYTEMPQMAEGWLTFSNTTLLPVGEAYNEDSDFRDVVRYLHYIYIANTLDEYRHYAKKCFGIDILDGQYSDKEAAEKEAELVDIYCTEPERVYIPTVSGCLVDGGENYLTYQFYADEGCLVPAYKVKYEFVRDGEEFFFKSSTLLDETGREACYAETIYGGYVINESESE